jgi:hypothetical protein
MPRTHRQGVQADLKRSKRRPKRPCRSAPAAPTNVTLTFGKREVHHREVWRARAKWDPVTTDVAGRNITVELYQVQFRATDASGVPVELDSGDAAIWRVGVEADASPLAAVHAPLARPRTWYYQVRVRAGNRIAGGKTCWSAWSAWTTPVQPTTGALPGPPAPTGLSLSFTRDESRRGNPWIAKAQWNEVPTWTPTDGDPVDGAHRYDLKLEVRPAGGTNATNVRRVSVLARDQDNDTTAFYVWHNITRKREYRVAVRAVDIYGRKGAWSAFTGWSRPPSITAPVTNLSWTHPRPRLYVARWDPPAGDDADGVVGYRVRVYRDGSPSTGTLVETADVGLAQRYRYTVPAADRGKVHSVRVRALYEGSLEEGSSADSGTLTEGVTWARDDVGLYQLTDTEIAWAGVSSLVLLAEGCSVTSSNDQNIPDATDTVVGFNSVEYSTPNFSPNLSSDTVRIDARDPSNSGVYLIVASVRFGSSSAGRREVRVEVNHGGGWSELKGARVRTPPVSGAPTDVVVTWVGRINIVPNTSGLRVVAFQNSGGALTLLAAGKRLAITYLGAPQFTSSPPSSGRTLGRRL